MYVIDTNVASELMRPSPAPAVAAWIAGRNAQEMHLTAVSEAELLYGVAIAPAGRRRDELEAATIRWLDIGFADRVLPFDSAAARRLRGDRGGPAFRGTSHRSGGLPDRVDRPVPRHGGDHAQCPGFRGHRDRGRRSLDGRMSNVIDAFEHIRSSANRTSPYGGLQDNGAAMSAHRKPGPSAA